MKVTIKEIKDTKNADWKMLIFKSTRNEAGEIVIPDAKFMLTEEVAELEVTVGDVVVI